MNREPPCIGDIRESRREELGRGLLVFKALEELEEERRAAHVRVQLMAGMKGP